MKKPYYRILSYLCVTAFLLYWVVNFILSMSSGRAKQILASHVPRFKYAFGTTWKLFTPPPLVNQRLYFIIRNIHAPYRADTLEVLGNISLKKQLAAPFNQKEMIIDHLVNNSVSSLIHTVWDNNKKPSEDITGIEDSSYIARAIAAKAGNRSYQAYLATLTNYCKIVMAENNIDTAGKAVKIAIREKMIRPFKEINNKGFVPKEILVFETAYKPVNP